MSRQKDHYLTSIQRFFRRSDFITLLLLFVPIVALAEAKENLRAFEIELGKRPGAKFYEVQISHALEEESTPVLTLKSEDTKFSSELKPGSYLIQTRTYDQRGVPGIWGKSSQFWIPPYAPNPISPQNKSELSSQKAEKDHVALEWAPSTGASAYHLEVSTSEGELIYSDKVISTKIDLELPVAQTYKWKVYALGPEGEKGDIPEGALDFQLLGGPIEPVKIHSPNTWFVRKLEWDKPEFTKSFRYRLFYRNQNDKKWRLISENKSYEKNELDFLAEWPGGHYRLEVQAIGEMRKPSEPRHILFGVVSGDRSPTAEERAHLLASFDKPSSYYFIASYLMTVMNYSSSNVEDRNRVKWDVTSGTGRLGLGYQKPKSKIGFFGVIDLSGFAIGEENVTFASSELHAVYQRYYARTRVRMGGGLYGKELPETKTADSLNFTTDKLSALGFHTGVDVWYPMTLRLGIQLNARLYYPLIGLHTPNDQPIIPEPSYQMGIMGSYRMSLSTVGFLGYAYRADQLSYKARFSDTPGLAEINEVDFKGHYLNILLEWAF